MGYYIDVGPETLLCFWALDDYVPSAVLTSAFHTLALFRFHHGKSQYVNQALVGLDRGADCYPNPMFPNDDGLELIELEGSCLTYEGEINKLAVNVAFGR